MSLAVGWGGTGELGDPGFSEKDLIISAMRARFSGLIDDAVRRLLPLMARRAGAR